MVKVIRSVRVTNKTTKVRESLKNCFIEYMDRTLFTLTHIQLLDSQYYSG